ncbi:unnamed protein product [Auanema sp. JU1783]|nr:unnamed protein product [Auanema sp. JU1783]
MADPVADFLAREQDIMAEIEGAPADPAAVNVVEADLVNEFGDMAVVPDPVSIQGGDSGVDLSGLMNTNPPAVNSGSLSSNGPSPVPVRVEAENIRRWREEQKVVLAQKDEAEEKKKQEWKTNATKELEDWYKQRDATLKGTKEANRQAEAEHLAAYSNQQGDAAQWDEIVKLCEAKAQKGGKDVSRMKSMILHLKEQHAK